MFGGGIVGAAKIKGDRHMAAKSKQSTRADLMSTESEQGTTLTALGQLDALIAVVLDGQKKADLQVDFVTFGGNQMGIALGGFTVDNGEISPLLPNGVTLADDDPVTVYAALINDQIGQLGQFDSLQVDLEIVSDETAGIKITGATFDNKGYVALAE